MVYDVKELKEYFDKRFNEFKNSLDVNNKKTPSAASNSTGTTKQRNLATL